MKLRWPPEFSTQASCVKLCQCHWHCYVAHQQINREEQETGEGKPVLRCPAAHLICTKREKGKRLRHQTPPIANSTPPSSPSTLLSTSLLPISLCTLTRNQWQSVPENKFHHHDRVDLHPLHCLAAEVICQVSHLCLTNVCYHCMLLKTRA